MSSVGAAPRAALTVSNSRAQASRRNGARSRGPKTPEGKARSSRNALKHGLRAEKHVMLPEEDAAAFEALEAALFEELALVGALQTLLARRIAVAAWRLERAERLEVEVFEHRCYGNAGAGLALIRGGNGTRSFDTLLRYRCAAMAELMRSLRALKALQAEQKATPVRAAAPAPVLAFEPKRTRGSTLAPHEGAPQGAAREKNPNQPEACSGPRDPPRRDRRGTAPSRCHRGRRMRDRRNPRPGIRGLPRWRRSEGTRAARARPEPAALGDPAGSTRAPVHAGKARI